MTPIFSGEKGGGMGLHTFQKANATSRLHFAACIFRDKADVRQKRKTTLNEKLVIFFAAEESILAIYLLRPATDVLLD